MRPVVLAMGISCALVGSVAWGDDGLLPDVSVSLRAARYSPSEPNFQETGWIGAGAGLVKASGATFYFTADLETVIGNVKRAVDPNQANYHLELGVDRPFSGERRLNPFFHHVSRHFVDLPKIDTVDWNVLGVRGAAPVFRGTRLSASVGHTTRTSLIGYEWELIGRFEGDLLPSRPQGPYFDTGARLVTTNRSPVYPRDAFVDGFLEGGWRFRRGDRSLDLFLEYEHRNDVELLAFGAKDRLLVGFHIGAGPSRDPWYWR
jgi:hypothetical protein